MLEVRGLLSARAAPMGTDPLPARDALQVSPLVARQLQRFRDGDLLSAAGLAFGA